VRKVISANSRAQTFRDQPSVPLPVESTSAESASTLSGSVGPQAAGPTSHLVGLRYVEDSPIRVRGLVSGMCYEFSGARAVQEVDVRDASSLLNTRFFRRA
jgi:hypothetical protein